MRSITMRATVPALVAVVLVAGAVNAAPDFASMKVQAYNPPKPAPPFSLPGLEGLMDRASRPGGPAATGSGARPCRSRARMRCRR